MRVLAFSGGKDSMACLHLMKETLDCAIYVDTGKTYPETQAMVKYASDILPVLIVTTDREGQNALEGIPADVVPINWTRFGQAMTTEKPVTIQSYVTCCYANISLPIIQKAKELRADEIVYGQRNEEATRSSSHDGDIIEGMVRRHPIENWTRNQVLDYLETKMDVPPHYFLNHSSLDCYDCTAYKHVTTDLVAFTKRRHPDFHKEYLVRADALEQALTEALKGERK